MSQDIIAGKSTSQEVRSSFELSGPITVLYMSRTSLTMPPLLEQGRGLGWLAVDIKFGFLPPSPRRATVASEIGFRLNTSENLRLAIFGVTISFSP